MFKFAIAVGATVLAVGANAQAFFDDFSKDQKALVRSDVGTSSNSVDLGGGVTRTQFLNLAQNLDSEGISRATSRVSSGWWTESTDDFVVASSGMNYNFANSLDLSDRKVFKFDFGHLDQASMLNVSLRSGGQTIDSSTSVAAGSGPFSVVSFGYPASNFNFRTVDQISFALAGPEAVDFRVNSVEAVPEPATMAVLGMGVIAFLRKRKKN